MNYLNIATNSSTTAVCMPKVDNKPIGNIIDQIWYKVIVSKNDKPDLNAITVFSEIFYWYRPRITIDSITGEEIYSNKFPGELWQTSYSHFEEKFGYNHQKTRRALVSLEKLGLVERIITNIKSRGQKYGNVLFIKLNIDALSKLMSSYSTNRRLVSTQNNVTQIIVEPIITKHFSDSQVVDPSLHICRDHIKNNKTKEYKDRYLNRFLEESTQSSFIKNNFEEKKQDCKTENQTRNSNEQINNQDKNNEESKTGIKIPIQPKQLKDFYPLSEEDAEALAIASGRNYGLRGLNELLRDVAEKLKDRWFRSKAGFMSYMAKLLKFEMRDIERINDENFRIKSRDTDQSIEAKEQRAVAEQEKYLEEIEYSLQVSPEWHLKKKLCAVLERKKAYDLLKSYRFGRIEGNRFKLHLRHAVHLSEREKEIILNQIKATHEGDESRNRIGELSDEINSLEIVVFDQNKNQSGLSGLINPSASVANFTGIWGKVRQSLISYYKDLGQALDVSWFSKLTPEEDHANKKLTLKAPTSFICNYVQQHYQNTIEKYCQSVNYQLIGIC